MWKILAKKITKNSAYQTCFSQRRARGDKGITHTDWCGKLHDSWYDKKGATREQIKRADDDFRRCVKAAPGERINKRLMSAVFAGKRMLEKKAGLNPLRGTSSEVEKKSMPKVKEEMRRKGNGRALCFGTPSRRRGVFFDFKSF